MAVPKKLPRVLTTNLSGLEKLTRVGGDILIERNEDLTDVTTLSGVTEIGGALVFRENPNLTYLPRFSAIQNLKALRIVYNNSLSSFDGFSSLVRIDTGWRPRICRRSR